MNPPVVGANHGGPAVLLARARRTPDPAPEVGASWPWPTALVHALEELRGEPWVGDWAAAGAGIGAVTSIRVAHRGGAERPWRSSSGWRRPGSRTRPRGSSPGRTSRGSCGRVFPCNGDLPFGTASAAWRPQAALVSLRHRDETAVLSSIAAVQRQLNELGNAAAGASISCWTRWSGWPPSGTRSGPTIARSSTREILRRLELADATPQQRQFFSEAAWQVFAQDLRQWISEPVNYGMVLHDLERLELERTEEAAQPSGRSLPGHALVADRRRGRARGPGQPALPQCQRPGRHLRSVAQSTPPAPRNDRGGRGRLSAGGADLRRSRVSTRLRLVLFPDRQQWRMGLEAARRCANRRTETKRGPAIFHNAGRSRYLARKVATGGSAGDPHPGRGGGGDGQ